LLSLFLIVTLLILITLLLTPAIIELRKPRDKGPRRILHDITKTQNEQNSEERDSSWSQAFLREALPKNLQQILTEFKGKKISVIGVNTVKIFGDMKFPSEIEVEKSLVVEGFLILGERCLFGGSLKASENVSVGSKVVIKGDLITDGNAYIGNDVTIKGSVHAKNSVRVGKKTVVHGSIVVAEV
jgi:NDP-sugar pyrophosphorylase family protein